MTHGGYFEILIAGYLNLRFPIDTKSGEKSGKYVALGYMGICLIALPFVWVLAIRRSVKNLNTRRFQSRFGALFDDINKKNKWKMMYYLIFIIRRAIFCVIAFNMEAFPLLQVQCLMWINLFIIIYTGSIRPFDTRAKNSTEICNEIFIIIVTGHDLFFTDIVDTREM